MLSTVLPSGKNIKVQLLVSKKKNEKICRYKKAICLPILYSRKNIYRFLNFFKIIKFLKKTIKKDNKHKIILFVRNEPIYLIACSFVKPKKVKLIFQSSFPHEVASGYFIKKMIAKIIFKICENKIDSLLAVSPKGLKRVSALFPKIKNREFIPLLADFFPSLDHHKISKKKVKFIYTGSHTHHRKLDVVLRAIVKAYDKGLKAQFKFIGGDFSDIERLRIINGVKELQEKKNLIFIERIPRKKIWSELRTADIGLCLIPPDKHYIEASPTKLSEYMGAGLAIVASYGIDLQEQIIQKSRAGVLCNWNEDHISDCLINICNDVRQISNMKKKGLKYAKKNLNYLKYIDTFKKLI